MIRDHQKVMIYPKRGNGNDGEVIIVKIYIRKSNSILRSYFNTNMHGDWCLVLESSYLQVYMQDKGPKNSLLFHSSASEFMLSQHCMKAGAYFPFHDVNNCQSQSFPMVPFQQYHGYTPSYVCRYYKTNEKVEM